MPWGRTFLIGGGPSLRGFPFDRLRGVTTVAINEAIVHVPWAAAMFSLDANWIGRRRAAILDFPGERYLAPRGDFPQDLPGVCYLTRSRAAGLSDDPAVICVGGSSGYGALNLAYLKGAKEIVLLGYDFCTGSQGSHWHAGYSWRAGTDQSFYAAWAENFNSTLPQLKRAGVRVWNASPKSLITAYPKVTLEDVLAGLETPAGTDLFGGQVMVRVEPYVQLKPGGGVKASDTLPQLGYGPAAGRLCGDAGSGPDRF